MPGVRTPRSTRRAVSRYQMANSRRRLRGKAENRSPDSVATPPDRG
jgi:hypothetical protein